MEIEHRSTFYVSLIIAIMIVVCITVLPAHAQVDFDAFLGNPIPAEEIDGTLGSEWNDAGNYSEVAIDPPASAQILTKHDETYLYIAMQFEADSSNPWVGFQFEQPNHMSSGADGAIFGHDGIGADQYQDISFGGFGVITADGTQNGVGAIHISPSNLVTVELKKPLSSGDSSGADIDWTIGNTYTLIIRWDSNGGGSSGGQSSHFSGSVRDRTIHINADEIPEFSLLTMFVTLATITLVILIFKRTKT